MSKRYNALIVRLDHLVHEEDIPPIIEAIGMIRGVRQVEKEPGEYTVQAYWAYLEAKDHVRGELVEAINRIDEGKPPVLRNG